jgi:hypothetical protein
MVMLGSYQHTVGPTWSPGSTRSAGETTKVYLHCFYGLRGLKNDWRILTGHKALSPKGT